MKPKPSLWRFRFNLHFNISRITMILTDAKDLRIVFMGTPEFAVASLAAMVENGYNVIAVITAPDKPAGRGKQLQQSAVKEYATSKQIPFLQPERLKNKQFLAELATLKADLQVVVAFRMLPEAVWDMPRLGTINVHASLLPQYRGAAPINWAVINGEPESGVTTFKLKHEIDTGDILLQERLKIADRDNVGTVYERLMKMGASLLLQTIDGLANDRIPEIPQLQIENLKSAPKIFKETGLIQWENEVKTIYNLIRGLAPYPGAYTFLDGKLLKIFNAEIVKEIPTKDPGDYDTDQKTFLRFAAKDGWVDCKEIQIEGKKRMEIKEFLRGYKF